MLRRIASTSRTARTLEDTESELDAMVTTMCKKNTRRAGLLAAGVAFATLLRPIPAIAQQVRLYVSSLAGDRLAAKSPAQFAGERPGAGIEFQIDDAVRHQQIVGFGASFLEAGMICLNSLPPAGKEQLFRSLFDPVQGAGYTAMKTVIAGTDFMSAGPWYTYDDVPGDLSLAHFDIRRDVEPNGLIPFIKGAQKYGKFILQAPMDYPPDWMLVDVNKNQNVNPKYYDVLARYYLRYLREYKKQGITIDYLSLFNEPDVYTKIPYTAIRELLRDHAGPLIRKESPGTKIAMSESPSREDGYKNFPTVLDDPGARKFVDVIEYHGYDFKNYTRMKELGDRYNLPLWMTEVCHAYEAGTPRTMKLPNLDFKDGDFWGNQIFSDLENDASAWIYWNMILDERGGPWAVSPIHGNPDPNEQHPVVVVNRQTHEVIYTGLYYYLAHFSKFVRPGAVRIGTRGGAKGVRCMGFRGPDGTHIAELMNSTPDPVQATVSYRGRFIGMSLPGYSITTATW